MMAVQVPLVSLVSLTLLRSLQAFCSAALARNLDPDTHSGSPCQSRGPHPAATQSHGGGSVRDLTEELNTQSLHE